MFHPSHYHTHLIPPTTTPTSSLPLPHPPHPSHYHTHLIPPTTTPSHYHTHLIPPTTTHTSSLPLPHPPHPSHYTHLIPSIAPPTILIDTSVFNDSRLFTSKLRQSYQCDSRQSIVLGTTFLTVTNWKVQAFNFSNQGSFDSCKLLVCCCWCVVEHLCTSRNL